MLQVFLSVLFVSCTRAEPTENSEKLIEDRYHSDENCKHVQTPGEFDTSSSISQYIDDLISQLRREERTSNGIPEALSIMLNGKEIDAQMQIVERNMLTVDKLYQNFRDYLAHPNEINRYTLKKFAETVTDSKRGSVMDSLHEIHYRIISDAGSFPRNSLLILLEEEWKMTYTSVCDRNKSAQDSLYDLYTRIVQTEIKVIQMLRYAYRALEIFHGSRFTVELNREETRFLRMMRIYKNAFETSMLSAPRTLQRCDSASGHDRGLTFHEFEKFMGVVIVHETALNAKHSCFDSCELDIIPRLYPQYDESFKGDCNELGCKPGPQFCYGSLEACIVMRSPLTICMGDEHSSRRYDWLQNAIVYGNNSMGCPDKLRSASGKWNLPASYCELCACTCIENNYRGHASKFISLREVTSNIADNMIVTGLQFVKRGSIIQIRIQVSRLKSRGMVDPDSTFWQQPEDLSFDRKVSIVQGEYVFLQSSEKILTPEADIAILTLANRTINLDELHVPRDSVMTGVRFSRRSEALGNPIQLEIRATTFDYKSGRLLNISNWITADDMKSRLEVYKLERTKVIQPLLSKNPLDSMHTTPTFQPNKWIQLGITSFRGDAGQTVIPLLDALRIAGQPPVPLSGINLFHKSAEEYDGFLSFQIISLDRSRHMDIGDVTV